MGGKYNFHSFAHHITLKTTSREWLLDIPTLKLVFHFTIIMASKALLLWQQPSRSSPLDMV
jgi:hypothetical protein